ncbi:MAG: isoprenylcysteine carboxylmethyltransferase family protein [Kiritimatiellales bacterium]
MEAVNMNHPRILISPPLIIGIPFVTGMTLHWLVPLRMPLHGFGLALGGLCTFPAAAILIAARRTFRQANTSMLPARRNRALITGGPFRFTRNPLYLGLVLLYAGVCLAAAAVWPLLFLPVVVALLHWIVILPEEKYLEDRFGDDYRAYKARVRRWV